MKITIAVCQYEVPLTADDDYKKALSVATQAKELGAKLLVLPETALGMLGEVRDSSVSYFDLIRAIAVKARIAVATSFYHKETDSKIYNMGVVFTDEGKLALSHKKVYLATSEYLTDGVSAGKNVSVTTSRLGNLGMLICKDSFTKYSHLLYKRFGELLADIIIVPAWSLGTHDSEVKEYIKTLQTYGAFISRSFVLVSGNLNKETKSFGQALIIDPISGVLQIGSSDKEELLIETIDLARVKLARQFDKTWQPTQQLF
jgi:predicted amidohydrolase